MAVSVCTCMNCGGPVRYDIPGKVFACDHCGSTFALEQMQNAYPDEQFDSVWDAVNESVRQADDLKVEWKSGSQETEVNFKTYTCPSCGAEVMTDNDTLAAAFCAFCDNPVTISERLVSGTGLPSRMIPFRKTIEEASKILRSKTKHKPLLPVAFKTALKNNKFASVYVPFRLFDADCSAGIIAEGINTSTWRDSRYEYTKTDIYEARRAGVMAFNDVPVDASDKIPDDDMQAIEPFETSELTPFSQKYLMGHFAEAPTTNQESIYNTVSSRLRPAAQDVLLRTVTGYGSVRLKYGNTAIGKLSSEYVMFPVWLMTVKHKGADLTYSVNGQTGKFTGKFPVDWKRAARLFGIIAAIAFLAIVIGGEAWLWIFG